MAQNLESSGAVEDGGSAIDKLGDLWCAFMHDAPSWPIHGHYTCRVCGRRRPVGWESQIEVSADMKPANLPASAEQLTSVSTLIRSIGMPRTLIKANTGGSKTAGVW